MIDNEKELENGLEEPVQTEKSAQEEVTEMPGASTEKDAPVSSEEAGAPDTEETAASPAPEAPPVQQPAQTQMPVNHGPATYYYAPQQPYGYQQPMPYAPVQKKKMPVGLKVLIIVMCVLFGVALCGFIGYGAYTAVTNIFSGFDIPVDVPEMPGDFGMLPEKDKEDKDNKEETEDTENHEIVIPDIEVTPNTEGIFLHGTPDTPELDITEVYDKVMRSTVLILVTAEAGSGSGTGIMATEDGYIITNSHVVLNSRNVEVEVKMNDGSTHDAVVVGFDKTTDLAVLKIEGSGYTPAEFADSDSLRMGQWVIAIGNPGGEQFSGSITRGIVSGLDRSVGSFSSNGMTYIQTDAAINPGNSGGPLVNLHGQVVGINSAKIVSDQYEGMGFAIPTTGAKVIIDDLLSGGYVQGRVRFGIKGSEINAMQAYTSQVPYGFLISEIDPDSSFIGTDVEPYDIITKIDGVETPTLDALSNALLSYAPGDTVTVTLFRPSETGPGGEEFEVEVTLLADLGETQN